MEPQQPTLKLVYALGASNDLKEIWFWNAQQHGVSHADRYIAFLKGRIDELRGNYQRGRTVGTRPDLHYILIRRRSGGHGHVAVYTLTENEVRVLNVFHTAQDWRNRLNPDA